MEAAETSKESDFKSCGRVGRRGACAEVEIPAEKLKEIIKKANESFDNASEDTEIKKKDNNI